MRKRELVYVHGLLVELREFYEQRTGESISTPRYDEMDVRPTSIHYGKPDHQRAVFVLAAELAEEMGTTPSLWATDPGRRRNG